LLTKASLLHSSAIPMTFSRQQDLISNIRISFEW
jgi:hypothetical protein